MPRGASARHLALINAVMHLIVEDQRLSAETPFTDGLGPTADSLKAVQ